MLLDLPVPTEVTFGPGAVSRIGTVAAAWGDSALVVCGRTAMRRHGVLQRVTGLLGQAGLSVTVFDQVSANPRSDEADRAVQLARRAGCNVVVALGGGSAIDAAKAVAVGIDRDSVRDLIGTTVPAGTRALPLVAVPTTAGSGSEVTRGAILTDSVRGFKSGIRGDAVAPRAAVVDPDLTAFLPAPVAAEAGFDALTHAIEGHVCRAATPASRELAQRVIRLVQANLPDAAAGRADAAVRSDLALAALYGGVIVATVSTCLPHRLQQAMGSVPEVSFSHGRGLAALYPAWLRAVEPYAAADLAAVAAALGADDVHHGVQQIRAECGLTADLTQAGYRAPDIERFLGGVSGNLDNDPIPGIDTAIMCDLYARALHPSN
jgi:alcohol dehydrogenase class IV